MQAYGTPKPRSGTEEGDEDEIGRRHLLECGVVLDDTSGCDDRVHSSVDVHYFPVSQVDTQLGGHVTPDAHNPVVVWVEITVNFTPYQYWFFLQHSRKNEESVKYISCNTARTPTLQNTYGGELRRLKEQ